MLYTIYQKGAKVLLTTQAIKTDSTIQAKALHQELGPLLETSKLFLL